jgi:hypothetical protein
MTENYWGDLLYFSSAEEYNAASARFKELLPDAEITDASDEIHPYRFSLEKISILPDDYKLMLLENGLSFNSLHFGLDIRMHPGKVKGMLNKLREKREKERYAQLIKEEL